MAGRNRLPAHPLKGGPRAMPPMREGPYARGPGPLPPHAALVDEIRDGPYGRGPGPLPPHPALLEEKLAAQHQEIQGLLVENQRLAATHVALRQELAAAQQELQHLNHVAGNMQADKEHQLRELYDKSMKMEADLRANEPIKAELMQLRADNQKMGVARQDLTAQVQSLTQDLVRARADMQQVGAMRAEMESMHQELQRARTAIEYEKKARADQLEQGQAMEKNLISMAREVEKLRAELANADKRGRAAANPGGAYAGSYGSAEMGYSGGGPYGDGYGMHPVQGGAESGGQYGAGAAPWGAYDMQRSHAGLSSFPDFGHCCKNDFDIRPLCLENLKKKCHPIQQDRKVLVKGMRWGPNLHARHIIDTTPVLLTLGINKNSSLFACTIMWEKINFHLTGSLVAWNN